LALSVQKSKEFVRMSGAKSDVYRVVRNEGDDDSQIAIVRSALVEYGLSENEAEVYLHLARVGERKASDVAEVTHFHRTEVYRILRVLEKKGIVIETFETPLRFTAVPVEKAVEQLVDAQRMKLNLLEKRKSELVQLWASMRKPPVEEKKKEVLQMLDGESQVILKAKELLEMAKIETKIFAPDDCLGVLYNNDFLADLEQRSYDLNVSLLTENSLKSRLICEHLGWAKQAHSVEDVEGLPCFIITDKKNLLVIYRRKGEERGRRTTKTKTVGLWTNCGALVVSMLGLFSRIGESS
jgi:sugar-specific transcriptional regulator TrmB